MSGRLEASRSGAPATILSESTVHARAFRFPAEVILWAVRGYLQFPISYRDLERMLADRGIEVDHVTLQKP